MKKIIFSVVVVVLLVVGMSAATFASYDWTGDTYDVDMNRSYGYQSTDGYNINVKMVYHPYDSISWAEAYTYLYIYDTSVQKGFASCRIYYEDGTYSLSNSDEVNISKGYVYSGLATKANHDEVEKILHYATRTVGTHDSIWEYYMN